MFRSQTLAISRFKDTQFNQNMDIIETQFRQGDISFIDAATEHNTTQTHTEEKRTNHRRKVSALTKDFQKMTHRRSRSPHVSTAAMKSPHRKHSYQEFQDEPENAATTTNRNTAGTNPYDLSPVSATRRKKIIGELSVSSSSNMRSTAAPTSPNLDQKVCKYPINTLYRPSTSRPPSVTSSKLSKTMYVKNRLANNTSNQKKRKRQKI